MFRHSAVMEAFLDGKKALMLSVARLKHATDKERSSKRYPDTTLPGERSHRKASQKSYRMKQGLRRCRL